MLEAGEELLTGVGGSESEDIEALFLLEGTGDGQEDNELEGEGCELFD